MLEKNAYCEHTVLHLVLSSGSYAGPPREGQLLLTTSMFNMSPW